MNFSDALEALKDGYKVKRAYWGGYWFMEIVEHWGEFEPEPYEPPCCRTEMIMAKLKDYGGYAPAQPYQADLLANDWELVD